MKSLNLNQVEFKDRTLSYKEIEDRISSYLSIFDVKVYFSPYLNLFGSFCHADDVNYIVIGIHDLKNCDPQLNMVYRLIALLHEAGHYKDAIANNIHRDKSGEISAWAHAWHDVIEFGLDADPIFSETFDLIREACLN